MEFLERWKVGLFVLCDLGQFILFFCVSWFRLKRGNQNIYCGCDQVDQRSQYLWSIENRVWSIVKFLVNVSQCFYGQSREGREWRVIGKSILGSRQIGVQGVLICRFEVDSLSRFVVLVIFFDFQVSIGSVLCIYMWMSYICD